MNDKVGFGIVGCGSIAPWHITGVLSADNARLVALYDRNGERAREMADEYAVEKVYTSLDELLSDPEIQAVSICTPSGLHAKIGIAAAKAGKHVLCEKPLDITLERIDELINTAEENDVKVSCIFQRRTSPVWQAVHKAVTGGSVGKLLLADCYMKYRRSQEYYDSGGWRGTWEMDGGGALMNQGVHCIDLLCWIAGRPESVVGWWGNLARNIEVEDTAMALVSYVNGVRGVIEATTALSNGIAHRLEFHGEDGNILIEGDSIIRWETADGIGSPESGDSNKGGGVTNPTDISFDGHIAQIKDFVDAVIHDRSPIITGHDARLPVELILGIYQSGKTGEAVTFPL